MENQKQTPIRSYSDAGAEKLREMTENPKINADFLKFQGRVFKHSANVALEFFAQKLDAQFIATKEQWEHTKRSVAQSSKGIPFTDKDGGIFEFYDFSQIEEQNPPHRWTIHAKNAAAIKNALGIPENGSLINAAVQMSLQASQITESMAALRVPPQEFRMFSSSFVSAVQCMIAGRLEVGGSQFSVMPDAAMFCELRTESDKLGFLNLAANAARKVLLNIERAALHLEAAERKERNEEDQLRSIYGDDRGRMGADSGGGTAGSSGGIADEQNNTVESGTPERRDGLSVDTGSGERREYEMAASVRNGNGERREVLVQARPDQRIVQFESDGAGSIAGGRTHREVRDTVDGVHGGALSSGSDGDAVSPSVFDGGTFGGEIRTGISGDTGEGLREDDTKTDQQQLRGESGMASGDGLLRGQHGDEREGFSSSDGSLREKLNSVFSSENSETSTNSADVFDFANAPTTEAFLKRLKDLETLGYISTTEHLKIMTKQINRYMQQFTEMTTQGEFMAAADVIVALKKLMETAAELKKAIQEEPLTAADIQNLRNIKPEKISVSNFREEDVASTPKFEDTFTRTLGEKSPYQRTGYSPRSRDEQEVPIIDVQSRECSFSSVKKDISNEVIAHGRSAEGGLVVTNADTGWTIQISRKGLEDSIAHTKNQKNNFTYPALYHVEDLVKNAVLLDTTVSAYNNHSKSRDTLFMHKL